MIKLMPFRTVDTKEIIGTMVCGSIIGASIWILIFCLLWVIYSRCGESMNSSDMNSSDPSSSGRRQFLVRFGERMNSSDMNSSDPGTTFVFVNAVGDESGSSSRQDV